MAEYGLVRSFGIDDGELEHLNAQDCFVLGYELAQIDALLELGQQISRPVHSDNRARIEASCKETGRPYKLKWLEVDPSESWMQLDVAPRNEGERRNVA